jgi:hypothetical protein
MKVERHRSVKRKPRDVSDRNVPMPSNRDNVSQLNPSQIAIITKSGQIILKMQTPLRYMTPDQRRRLSLSWINDGKYKRNGDGGTIGGHT